MNNNMNEEIWKDIKGYEGSYQVSNHGRVRSLDREVMFDGAYGHHTRRYKGRVLSGTETRGYLTVTLSRGKWKRVYIHRMVAEHFLGNPENKPEVNHIDHNRLNNHYSNLEWVTAKENTDHKIKNNRHDSVLTEDQVREIRKLLESKKLTQGQIGKAYGVAPSTISAINIGKTWSYVN